MPGIASRRNFSEIWSGIMHSVIGHVFKGEEEYQMPSSRILMIYPCTNNAPVPFSTEP
jgi:hypothetical protein